MKGIAFLGLTTVLFWLVVAVGVARSLWNRHDQWWEAEGSPYSTEAYTEAAHHAVSTNAEASWPQL